MSDFAASWSAEVLDRLPPILPARRFVYPQQIAGEEDALARGALEVMVRPAAGGVFLATCALGFRAASLPSGVWACPRADDLLAVAGGYAYLVDTLAPERCVHLALRPVVQVLPLVDAGLVVLVGLHSLCAIGVDGLAWASPRLSSEGVTVGDVRGGVLYGTGWEMTSDRDVEFAVDLRDGSVVSSRTLP